MASSSRAIEDCIGKQGVKRDLDVEELYLAKSDIHEAPDFSRFKNLQRLWLSENKLWRLKGLESNYHMTELYLQNNMLTKINGALQHLTCLKVLFLQGNQLTVLTDVIHELRNMLNLENLNLFGNPLTQEYDYRIYVLHSIKSLKILDRQAISRGERVKAEKKYEIAKQTIKDTIAFGRRSTTADKSDTADQTYSYSILASCLQNDTSNAYSSVKQVQYVGTNDSVLDEELSDKGSSEINSNSETKIKEEPRRSLMQFNRFGWTDVLEARSKSQAQDIVPCIYKAKFR